jgi:predicted ester cyclase
MSTQEAKTIVLEFYQSFDNRNIDQAFTFLAPNFTAHLAGIPQPMDRDSFKQFGMEFYSAFPNGKHTFDEVIDKNQGSSKADCK